MSASGPSESRNSQSASQTTASSTGANSPVYAAGNNSTVAGGPLYQLSGRSSITVTDQGAIAAAADSVKSALASISDTNSKVIDAFKSNSSDNAGTLGAILQQNGTLAAQTQSGGATGQNKTILWIAGIAFAVLALFALKR